MALESTLNSNLKEAMKSGETGKVELLRGLLSSIHNRALEKRAKSGEAEELTDEDVLEVLRKEAKKRKEAAELFRNGGREDLASKEETELDLIKNYLPAELSREEIDKVIQKVIESGNSDFASVMRETMKELKGKAEGSAVKEAIEAKLKK